MTEKFTPIETEVGFLEGRDAIYYPKLTSVSDYEYCITGQLNGYNCSKVADKDKEADIPFSLTFKGVLWLTLQELDFYVDNESCFDLIENSSKLAQLRAHDKRTGIGKIDRGYDKNGKFSDEIYHQHFVLATYDIVYEVIAQSYDLVLEKPKSRTYITIDEALKLGKQS